ncbi:MAG: DUF1080 domain-containing protein [Verrucomicrobiales bacterium]|nr:DUF1080 domain-containing protein [Verrucomicrobiales bacterium]
MKSLTLLCLSYLGLILLTSTAEAFNKKKFPAHWGDPPKIQTRDFRPLPGGYGNGSSTLVKWISKNLEQDKIKGIPKKSFITLFGPDTKNLDGWSIKSGYASYKIHENSILGTTAKGSGNTFLCTDKSYSDFELEFEVKCNNKLNSGVQIRSQLKNPSSKYGGRVNGPQVEIEASGQNGAEAGYVYGEATGRGWLTPKERLKPHKHFKDGEWNKYQIIAKGNRIQTWINGNKIEDLPDEAIYKTHSTGLIGLQVHGIGTNAGPLTVQWRNIKIKEL